MIGIHETSLGHLVEKCFFCRNFGTDQGKWIENFL